MRELQLADCKLGVQETFADLGALAAQCRYSDCQHHSEPGCAVIDAVCFPEYCPYQVCLD